MNRRNFLAALIAGVAYDPEKLLWVPGEKLISIPAPRPVSALDLMSVQLERIRPTLMKLYCDDARALSIYLNL